VPAVLLPHGVEEHPGDHHVEAVVFEGQPPHVAFVGDPVGWFRERASWASKAFEIRSMGAGADRSRERERRRWAPVPDFRSEGARASDSDRFKGVEDTVGGHQSRPCARESVFDGRRCRISGREEQGRRIPVGGGGHDVLIAFFC
jgi:hypothetical protein